MKIMFVGVLLVASLFAGIAVMIINSPNFDTPKEYKFLDNLITVCKYKETHYFVGNNDVGCFPDSKMRETLLVLIPILGSSLGSLGILLLVRSFYQKKYQITPK